MEFVILEGCNNRTLGTSVALDTLRCDSPKIHYPRGILRAKLGRRMYANKLFSLAVLALGGLTAAGCAQKAIAPSPSDPYAVEAADGEDPTRNNSDTGPAMGLRTLHFEYRNDTLTPEAEALVAANAEVLKAHPRVTVQIEGHCDDRGAPERNFELGQRRAETVQKRLRVLGIQATRMSVISYGKESPVATGDTEDARKQNRRANFVITSK